MAEHQCVVFPRIKILRQRCDQWIGDGPAMRNARYVGRLYGGWRMWCGFCNAYEWAGREISDSMDYAREHCRKGCA